MPPSRPEKGAGEKREDRAFFSGRRWIVPLLVCLLAIIAAVVAARIVGRHAGGGQKAVAGPAVPVTAASAKRADFNIYIIGLGTVTPIATVAVHTRVDGQLMEVLYKEGQTVENGALLAVLDTRPFEAALLQAEGQLARDAAQLIQARIDLERYRALWAVDSIAKQQYDLQLSLVGQLEGAVKSDQGVVETARVNIIYCRITSPVAGKVGLRLVDPGNIVHTTDTNGIVVITQLHPMTVIFPIAEDSLPRVRAKLASGGVLHVDAYDRDMTHKLASGRLLTIDNQIDTTTGTVRLRAIFPNEDDSLFPNQFVNARLLIERVSQALVVPAAALQHGPAGTFVYAVRQDMTVAVAPVTAGAIQGGEAWIKAGLAPGDLVVTEGVDRLRQGARVELKSQAVGPIGPAVTGGP